ncbi:Protein SlyX homolog [Sterolibacterium denitrificans]|uniref:Protein SlyX homolog n=1 Tax=Sterolibacterium denitrificans TaxID=157592 RepID=A0A7Z7HRI9_9PROT|nr:SlyX family protein [Sterolibacterium denitrificans]SMB27591.1 Protein SlyX homolog [Sterolibacterium denitrificans]
MESRINELEAMLSLADDQLEQLNRVVFRQQEQIDRLQAQLRLIWERMDSLAPAERLSLREEVPPHY